MCTLTVKLALKRCGVQLCFEVLLWLVGDVPSHWEQWSSTCKMMFRRDESLPLRFPCLLTSLVPPRAKLLSLLSARSPVILWSWILVACLRKGETQKQDVAIRPLGQGGKENAWFFLLDSCPSRGAAVWHSSLGLSVAQAFYWEWKVGLLRLSGKGSPCQAGDTGSIPDAGRYHMRRSNWSHTPHLLSWHPSARGHSCWLPHALEPAVWNERPPRWGACILHLESSPHSPQPEKSLCSHEDPAQPKINKIIKEEWKVALA